MTPVLILLVIFGSITLWRFMGQAHEQKMAELRAREGASQAALPAANAEFEERLRHLESIVCSVDFELNSKLNRLASQQLALSRAQPGETIDVAAHTDRVTLGQLEPGTTLADRFEVDRCLGAGGMGSVYLARDRQLGERVAVKVIGGMAAIDAVAQERLRREASAARRISHPNVVRLHDIGDEKGLLFLSMEYVPGGSLKDLISRHGALPPGQVRPLLAQVLEGLAAAHAQGVVHRDLKPGNVLIDERGEAKIIDFGLARLPHLEGMTATGTLLGTPEYMAPEQIKGGAIDARTDLYALGAVTYHALTGRAPFKGANPIAVSLAQLTEQPPPLRSVRADLPEAWEAFVSRAMAKDPAHRFATATEMKAALPPG